MSRLPSDQISAPRAKTHESGQSAAGSISAGTFARCFPSPSLRVTASDWVRVIHASEAGITATFQNWFST